VIRDTHSPLISAGAAVAASTCVGLLIGLLITGLKLPPFIVTLGMWGGVRGAAKYFADDSTVYVHNADLQYWLNNLLWPPQARWMIFPTGVWLMLLLCLVVAAVLRYTRFGRHIFAIGSNEQTARLCGVPVNRTKILLYAAAGALAGIAGLMQFSDLGQGDPTTANGLELDIIAAVVIGGASLSGGRGTVLGTSIGSLIMKAVDNGCTQMQVKNSVEQMITGAIIVIACWLDAMVHQRE
jgi:ribose transport system permease protein